MLIKIAATFGNPKAQHWVAGRKNWESKLLLALADNEKPVIWIHASSTGEFEQGRTVLEGLSKKNSDHYFLLTFFSPSGYEVYKNYKYVDSVHYLPLDSASNAKRFISCVEPKLALFIKYEFWYYYFKELTDREVPLFLVSAIFNKDHMFFKWYGSLYRPVLQQPTMFFVQDEVTNDLLKQSEVKNTTITGDTRIDSVIEVREQMEGNASVEQFLLGTKAPVFGSYWEEEEKYLVNWLNSGIYLGKVIIAPHEIKEEQMTSLIESLQVKVLRYTQSDSWEDVDKAQVLIIDCVGILKQIYRYASWSFIGGGFVDGIHNILEPAVFGVPIIIGPNYQKFKEAIDLIEQGGVVSVNSYEDFIEESTKLMNSKTIEERSEICTRYIDNNKGATKKVLEYLNPYLN